MIITDPSTMNQPDDYAEFYNSDQGDRLYNSDSMSEWLTPFFKTGVFNGGMQVLANSPVDMGVTVGTGYVNIGGKIKHFYEKTAFTLAIAHSIYPRIDTIVVERNDTDRDFNLKLIQGEAAASPVPTAPVRENSTYQLVLAQIYVKSGETEITQAEITDTRMEEDLCGWVVATVQEISFSQITAQFNEFFSQYRALILTTYAQYVADSDSAYQAYLKILQDFEHQSEIEFTNWFLHVKDQLSTDVAGHLQNEVDDIMDMIITGEAKVALLTDDGEYILTNDGYRLMMDWDMNEA